jgi:hypothetical protein
MSRTRHISRSIVLLASVAALVAPTAATAYPVIGDDPASAESVAQGHTWYTQRVKRAQHAKPKPKPAGKPSTLCKPSKKSCRKP